LNTIDGVATRNDMDESVARPPPSGGLLSLEAMADTSSLRMRLRMVPSPL